MSHHHYTLADLAGLFARVAELEKRILPQAVDIRQVAPEANAVEPGWDFSGISADKVRTVQTICTVVLGYYGITKADLVKASREASVVWPRQVFCYLARTHAEAPLHRIGQWLGRDHGTVLHGFRNVVNRIKTEPRIAAEVGELEQHIKGKD
jgi:chromosomal replication initiation ATPase DnaA